MPRNNAETSTRNRVESLEQTRLHLLSFEKDIRTAFANHVALALANAQEIRGDILQATKRLDALEAPD